MTNMLSDSGEVYEYQTFLLRVFGGMWPRPHFAEPFTVFGKKGLQ